MRQPGPPQAQDRLPRGRDRHVPGTGRRWHGAGPVAYRGVPAGRCPRAPASQGHARAGRGTGLVSGATADPRSVSVSHGHQDEPQPGSGTQRDGLAQPEPHDGDHDHVRADSVARSQQPSAQPHADTRFPDTEPSAHHASPHTRPWLTDGRAWLSSGLRCPRERLRKLRRCRSRSPRHRPDARTRAGPVARAVRRAQPEWRQAGPPGWARPKRVPWNRQPSPQVAGRRARTQRRQAVQDRESGRDQAPGRFPRSTAGPTGLSPGTTQRGSTRRTRAAPALRLSARLQPRRR